MMSLVRGKPENFPKIINTLSRSEWFKNLFDWKCIWYVYEHLLAFSGLLRNFSFPSFDYSFL